MVYAVSAIFSPPTYICYFNSKYSVNSQGLKIFYSTSKIWCLGPRQGSMALPVKIASVFGVLEYWKIGVLEKAKARISI
jgi:hypothetical protein